jgi:endonuclease/exonuclease/phosphatase family metal-dependent hydrolase
MRIATFNLENLDEVPSDQTPSLATRIAILRPQLLRLRADVLCLQEIHGQERPNEPRRLLALDQLLAGTPYASYERVATELEDGSGQVYDVRNLVILSRFPLRNRRQIKQDLVPRPKYQRVTPTPADTQAKDVIWERPILAVEADLGQNRTLHVVNLHLKSKIPTDIPGQGAFGREERWNSVAGWAEGFFLSSMKRVGQALEARVLVDSLFDQNPGAWIAVAGDFNADSDDVPVAAIRGDVENTNNGALAARALIPCERSIPETARYSLIHHGRGEMIDHLLVSRPLIEFYRGAEVHNESLHDESIAFAIDEKFPESDHAAVVAEFSIPET